MKFGSEHIAELVKRVVSSVSPLRIILFGSAGPGRMRANSDLDILVIVANGFTDGKLFNQYIAGWPALELPRM